MLDDPLIKTRRQPTREKGYTIFPGHYKAVVRDMSGKKIGQFEGERHLKDFLAGCLSGNVYILQIFDSEGDMKTYQLIRK